MTLNKVEEPDEEVYNASDDARINSEIKILIA